MASGKAPIYGNAGPVGDRDAGGLWQAMDSGSDPIGKPILSRPMVSFGPNPEAGTTSRQEVGADIGEFDNNVVITEQPVKELGRVLVQIFDFLTAVPPHELFHLSKIDLADRFWRMLVGADDKWHF